MQAVQKSSKNRSLDRLLSIFIITLMSWFVVLCFFHYINQRPLWTDEAAVFESIEAFQTQDFFTQNLINGQNFPRLYLCLIQKFSQPFHFSLLSLRLFSFLALITAFFLWMRIARFEFGQKLHYLTYVFCWLASASLLYYASELKQYSMDVLSGAIYVLFLYHQKQLEELGERWKYGLILAALPALILFSYSTFFFFFFPLYNLILSAKKDKTLIRYIVIYVGSLLVFGFLAYYFDMRLRKVYGYEDYFIYFGSWGQFFQTLGEGTLNLFYRCLVERPRALKKILVFFFAIGICNMFGSFFSSIKKEGFYLRSLKTIPLILYMEFVIMGALKKYPFSVPRTSLFFCPIVLYLVLTAIIALKKIHPALYRIVLAVFLSFLIFIAIQLSYLSLYGQMSFAPLLWWFGETK